MFEQAVELEDHADLAAQLPERRQRNRRAAGQRHAIHDDGAGVEAFEPRDRAQNRRLARAGRAHQRHQLAARDIQRHAGQNRPPAATQVQPIGAEHDVAHGAGAFQRLSSRRAAPANGSDIAR